MSWTAPRTWATDELLTATRMNAHVRDNMLALALHEHSGAAGDGSITVRIASAAAPYLPHPASRRARV